jgi:hypothetical protein
MRKARDILLSLTLLALVFAGPAAVAAYFVAGDRPAQPLMLAAAGGGGSSGASAAPPVLAGVLYTKGSPQVDWNGVRTPISDGSYAYLGGEGVSSGANDMGVLQLEGENKVYMCPGSRMSLGRDDDGTYEITIYPGTGRFSFAPGTAYRIHANRSVYSPGPDGASRATVVEVAVFDNHPGGVACGFKSSLNVTAYPAGGGEPVALGTAGPGEVIDISRALNDEAAASGTPIIVQPVSMPDNVRAWLRDNAPYPAAPGSIGYLCRCEELKRYAEADGIPEAAIAPRMLPPGTDPLIALAADDGPPPAALAVPGSPNPADPGVLGVDTPVTVPLPLVPITGSGGGFVSTPS